MVGHRRHDAVDILAVEQFLVAACSREVGIPGDLFGQRVAAIVQVGGRHALHTGQRNGGGQQSGSLHADADHAEPDTIAGGQRLRSQQHSSGSEEAPAAAQERTAGKRYIHKLCFQNIAPVL
jgi:hypothetical protein